MPAWIFQTEDGENHEAETGAEVPVLQSIVDEYGDGAPVFVFMAEQED